MEELKNSIENLQNEVEELKNNIEDLNCNINNMVKIIKSKNKESKLKRIEKTWKKNRKKFKRTLNQIILIIANRIMCIIFRLKDNRVLFLSDVRENLGGNLEYLYNIIPDDKYVKVVSTKADRREKRSIKEKIRLAYNLSICKYVLLDDFSRTTSYIKVRKGQELIQLWHGPGAFKKFGHSRSIKNGGNLKIIHPGYKKYTKVITSSEEIRKCYAEAFGIDINKTKATGFPRTDMFFDAEYIENRKEQIYKKYPFLANKKIILFAPTYRGRRVIDANYDFEKLDIDKIYNEFKEEYIFVFKWHPALYNNIVRGKRRGYNLCKYNNFYYDLSNERDINDLLLITDILITDYSSVIFDYAFINKPVIYFAYDLEEYEQERGLYFDYKEYVYGKIAKNDDELIEAIKTKDMEPEKRKLFMEKFLGMCDGHSTEKTYEWIFKQ